LMRCATEVDEAGTGQEVHNAARLGDDPVVARFIYSRNGQANPVNELS